MINSLAEKLATYEPSAAAVKLVNETPILLLVGPTGAGKDTLKGYLLKTGAFHHIVSHTTRPPRINQGKLEENGVDYHFINKETAEELLNEKAFIEAKVYSGNLYGTSIAEIQAAHDEHKTAMTDIEVQGVAEYKTLDPSVVAIFILPPDFKTWQLRLKRRYGDVVDEIDYLRRLKTAQEELEQMLNTNYYVAVINDDLETTFHRVEDIMRAARDHKLLDDHTARTVAKRLAQDIQNYLETHDEGSR